MKKITGNPRFLWMGLILASLLSFTSCRTAGSPLSAPVQPGNTLEPGPNGGTSSQPQSEPPYFDQQAAMQAEFRSDLEALPALPHYRIQVLIDFHQDQPTFTGWMFLDYTNLESVPLEQLYLRLYPNGGGSFGKGSLKVEEVQVGGSAAGTKLSQSETVLEVSLPETLQPGDSVELSLGFSGSVPVDFGGEDDPTGYGIFNYSQQVLTLSAWYPILSVYDESGWNLDPVNDVGDAVFSDMAYYSVQVDLPEVFLPAMTGIELSRDTNADRVVYQYASGPAREFLIAASPNWQVTSQEVGGVQVNVLSLPDPAEPGKAVLKVGVDSLQAYNRIFGNYKFRELDVVQTPMRYAAGVEFPGIMLIRDTSFDDPTNPILWTTVAHEVAHQWWYNLVGNDPYAQPWLDEALTTYSSVLYWEAVFGINAYHQVIDDFKSRYQSAVEAGVSGEITQGIDFYAQSEHARFYSAVVYMKGALFFDALRNEIGDEAFFEGLRSYSQDYQYRIASQADLLAVFEDTSGRSLDSFYQEWLFSDN